MQTTVVNIRKEAYDVYIGRPGVWGNPFVIGRHGTREEVIEKYRQWVKDQPQIMRALNQLVGKRLGCYCKPAACHGDVLAEMVNALVAQRKEHDASNVGVEGSSPSESTNRREDD